MIDIKKIKFVDECEVDLVASMGSDEDIVQSARVSYGNSFNTQKPFKDLLKYLYTHNHTSPFEMGELKFFIHAPIFVARQLFRHRTANVNEISMRYTHCNHTFYLINDMDFMGNGGQNKQCGNIKLEKKNAQEAFTVLKLNTTTCYRRYLELISLGVSREQARLVLPMNTMTKFYFKIDVNNFLKL